VKLSFSLQKSISMTLPSRFDFPLAKAQYLFSRATGLGVGGDKRKFWQEVMGFASPEAIKKQSWRRYRWNC
jgi:hypothetical protein